MCALQRARRPHIYRHLRVDSGLDVMDPVSASRHRPAMRGSTRPSKLDGYRTAAHLDAGKVRMLTRSGLDWTARFRPITAALALPKIRSAYLDGEITLMGEDGVTSFAALQDALSRGQVQRFTYRVFDLLHLGGRDLTGLPLIERKTLLAPLLAGEVDSLFSEQCRLSGEVPDPARAQTLLLSKGRQGGHRHRPPYAVHGVVIIAERP